jgi:hypothetical protein
MGRNSQVNEWGGVGAVSGLSAPTGVGDGRADGCPDGWADGCRSLSRRRGGAARILARAGVVAGMAGLGWLLAATTASAATLTLTSTSSSVAPADQSSTGLFGAIGSLLTAATGLIIDTTQPVVTAGLPLLNTVIEASSSPATSGGSAAADASSTSAAPAPAGSAAGSPAQGSTVQGSTVQGSTAQGSTAAQTAGQAVIKPAPTAEPAAAGSTALSKPTPRSIARPDAAAPAGSISSARQTTDAPLTTSAAYHPAAVLAGAGAGAGGGSASSGGGGSAVPATASATAYAWPANVPPWRSRSAGDGGTPVWRPARATTSPD